MEASLLQLSVDMLHVCEEPLLDVILMATLFGSDYNLREGFHCSYYRPPSSGTQSITESLSPQLYNRNVSPDLILAGNFSLPDIGWQDGRTNPQK